MVEVVGSNPIPRTIFNKKDRLKRDGLFCILTPEYQSLFTHTKKSPFTARTLKYVDVLCKKLCNYFVAIYKYGKRCASYDKKEVRETSFPMHLLLL